MDPQKLFKRRLGIAIAGFAAIIALIYLGDSGIFTGVFKSQAATVSYANVLSEIQQATSSVQVYALARQAGLDISSSSDLSNPFDTDQSLLITDPQTNEVLAAVTEYDDNFPLTPSTTVSAPSTTITSSSITITGTSNNGSQLPTVTVNASLNNYDGEYNPAGLIGLNLVWSSQNANSCVGSGDGWTGGNGPVSLNGSDTFYLNSNVLGATYIITCSGPGGSASSSAVVNTGNAESVATSTSSNHIPVVGISGYLTATASSNTLTLTWSSEYATSCVASGAWSGSQTLSGTSAQFLPAGISSTYTITCSGPGGYANSSVSATGQPVVHDNHINSDSAQPLDLLDPPIAYAQSTGGSVVVGNNTGQAATCSIAGSNGAGTILVFPNGQLYGVGGNANYNFFVQNVDINPVFTALLDGAAHAADGTIQALGGPTVLASDSNNQITAVLNENPITNGLYNDVADGIALSVSTLQPDGTYNNSCTANLFVSIAAQSGTSIYMQNVLTHEIGHCLGLGHTEDPNNIMYGGGLGSTNATSSLLTFNATQIQFIKDRRAGKTIYVTPSSCEAECGSGSVAVVGNSSTLYDCYSANSLCNLGFVFSEQTQTCFSCPSDTTVNSSTNECDITGLNTSCIPDPISGLCLTVGQGCTAEQLANGYVNDLVSGECGLPYTAVTSSIVLLDNSTSTQNQAYCLDANNNKYLCSATNCGCDGQLACPSNVPPGSGLDANGNSYLCSATATTPTSTTDDYCAQNPSDPDCVNYCETNPTDAVCIGTNNTVNDTDFCTQSPTDPSCTATTVTSDPSDSDGPTSGYEPIWDGGDDPCDFTGLDSSMNIHIPFINSASACE